MEGQKEAKSDLPGELENLVSGGDTAAFSCRVDAAAASAGCERESTHVRNNQWSWADRTAVEPDKPSDVLLSVPPNVRAAEDGFTLVGKGERSVRHESASSRHSKSTRQRASGSSGGLKGAPRIHCALSISLDSGFR